MCRAWISTLSFPAEAASLSLMLQKNRNYGSTLKIDYDALANYRSVPSYEWTVHSRAARNDIVFLYMSKSAVQHARKVLSLIQPNDVACMRAVEHGHTLAEGLGGKIFGYAVLAENARHSTQSTVLNHYKNQPCATFKSVRIFDVPVDFDQCSSFIQIKRKGACTPLMSPQAKSLWSLCMVKNPTSLEVPPYFGDNGFTRPHGKAWQQNMMIADSEYKTECHVSEYFAEPLLHRLRDKHSPLLRECTCLRGTVKKGQVDYLVRIKNSWWPVEVKLDFTPSIPAVVRQQLTKYIRLDGAVPQLAPWKNRIIKTVPTDRILVFDKRAFRIVCHQSKQNEFEVLYECLRSNITATTAVIRRELL